MGTRNSVVRSLFDACLCNILPKKINVLCEKSSLFRAIEKHSNDKEKQLDAGYPESPRQRYFDAFISQSMDTFYTRQLLHQAPFTSSTAQGGGGSFKNRKPIGEIGCCESPMAEQKH